MISNINCSWIPTSEEIFFVCWFYYDNEHALLFFLKPLKRTIRLQWKSPALKFYIFPPCFKGSFWHVQIRIQWHNWIRIRNNGFTTGNNHGVLYIYNSTFLPFAVFTKEWSVNRYKWSNFSFMTNINTIGGGGDGGEGGSLFEIVDTVPSPYSSTQALFKKWQSNKLGINLSCTVQYCKNNGTHLQRMSFFWQCSKDWSITVQYIQYIHVFKCFPHLLQIIPWHFFVSSTSLPSDHAACGETKRRKESQRSSSNHYEVRH